MVERTKLALIEDDPNIVDIIQANLMARRFEVLVSPDGQDVLEAVADDALDIVLLDLMLPSANGFDLCREIRQRSDVGIIVISARVAEDDKVRALHLGADDYMTKPFGIDELLARIAAILRRSRPHESADQEGTLTIEKLHIDRARKTVHYDGHTINLTPTEFSLLVELVVADGALLSHERLLRRVWGMGYENSREYVHVYVRRLRNKLGGDEGGGVLILTEPRAGYRLVDPANRT